MFQIFNSFKFYLYLNNRLMKWNQSFEIEIGVTIKEGGTFCFKCLVYLNFICFPVKLANKWENITVSLRFTIISKTINFLLPKTIKENNPLKRDPQSIHSSSCLLISGADVTARNLVSTWNYTYILYIFTCSLMAPVFEKVVVVKIP